MVAILTNKILMFSAIFRDVKTSRKKNVFTKLSYVYISIRYFRYELYFAFACIWAFGSAMFRDQLIDWRNEFSKWWQNEFRTVKFPTGGTVFSYFIEPETKKLVPWTEKVVQFELDSDIPLQVPLIKLFIF